VVAGTVTVALALTVVAASAVGLASAGVPASPRTECTVGPRFRAAVASTAAEAVAPAVVVDTVVDTAEV
jgi:hypothetical protein